MRRRHFMHGHGPHEEWLGHHGAFGPFGPWTARAGRGRGRGRDGVAAATSGPRSWPCWPSGRCTATR